MNEEKRLAYDAQLEQIRNGWRDTVSPEAIEEDHELTQLELASLAIYSAQVSAS